MLPIVNRETLQSFLEQYFGQIPDPRVERTRAHQLLDIIAIALLAVLSGADSWVAIETYGNAKRSWLESFLSLPNGIPSHDTFRPCVCPTRPASLGGQFPAMGQSIDIDLRGLRENSVPVILEM